MKFTDLFINRPVIAVVVSALLLILGIQSVTKLPIREFPALEKGQITVNTFYPGASARTVQGFVTNPLQRRVANAQGVEYLTSESNPGQSQIIVHVRLGENTSEVLSEVIAKVNEARSELPRDIEDPVVSTSDGGDALMYLAFLSDKLSEAQVTDYLLRAVQPELATLEGVGSANILGSRLGNHHHADDFPTHLVNITYLIRHIERGPKERAGSKTRPQYLIIPVALNIAYSWHS